MPTDLESLRTDFPERLSGRWSRFTKNDIWFLAAMLGVAVLANHYLGRKGGFLAVCIWFALTMTADYDKLHGYMGHRLNSLWIQKGRKEVVWDAQEETIFEKAPPIDLAVEGLDELGWLHGRGKDTVVIEAEGSDIASLELEGQFDSHLALGEVIRKVAALAERHGHDAGWGWLYRTRPLNLPNLANTIGPYLHPEVWEPSVLPQVLTAGENGLSKQDKRNLAYGENIQQLLEVSGKYSREVTMAAVCTVKRTTDEDIEKHLAQEEPHRFPLVQVADMVAAELEACGVIDPRPLTPRGMHAFVRGGWDIARIGDYYEWLEEASSDEEVLSSEIHLPEERITTGNNYLSVDGTYHTVLWLKKVPPRPYPNQLRKLFDINVPWLSVALVGTTTRTKAEYAFLDRYASLSAEIEHQAGVVHKGPKKQEKHASRISRQKKIHESRYGQDYNLLIAVHHLSERELENAVDEVLKRLNLANLSADRVVGRVWQLPFLLSAITAIDVNML